MTGNVPGWLREAFVADRGEPWTVSYVDSCTWLEDERALQPRTGMAGQTLLREAERGSEVIGIEDLRRLTAEYRAKQTELEEKLAKIETPSEVAIHPGAAAAYGALARQLHEVMQGSEGEEVRRALRDLIEGVEFIPLEGMGRFDLKVRGRIAALLTMSEAVKTSAMKCDGPWVRGQDLNL